MDDSNYSMILKGDVNNTTQNISSSMLTQNQTGNSIVAMNLLKD